MLLTDQEREKFIQYLRQSAETSEGMLKQFEELSLMPELIKREKIKAAAYRVVLADLQAVESTTL